MFPEFLKSPEKRSYQRHLLNLPLEYYWADIKIGRPGFTLNISEEGLAVDLPEKLEVGQGVKLRLLHRTEGSVEIFAKVVWINPPAREGEMHQYGMSVAELSLLNRAKWEMLLVNASLHLASIKVW
jgi:Tfp pilus assembly protein PilZ